jgi:hypothetical protein
VRSPEIGAVERMSSGFAKRSNALTLNRYRDSFALLREFDGWRCWWSPVASAVILAGLYLLPVVGGVASVYVGGSNRDLLRVTIGVCIALALAGLSTRLLRHEPWLAPLDWRFRRYETPGDFSESWPVLLREGDYDRAQSVLRRARLSPHSGRRTPPPPDAPLLDSTFTVSPTRATPTGIDLCMEIAHALSNAGIGGRVGGHEFSPQTELR